MPQTGLNTSILGVERVLGGGGRVFQWVAGMIWGVSVWLAQWQAGKPTEASFSHRQPLAEQSREPAVWITPSHPACHTNAGTDRHPVPQTVSVTDRQTDKHIVRHTDLMSEQERRRPGLVWNMDCTLYHVPSTKAMLGTQTLVVTDKQTYMYI